MLQETRFQVQVLKPCKSIQEKSVKVLDFKVRQLAFIEIWKAAATQNSTTSSIDTLSIKVYEIHFFRVDFTSIREYVYRFSFLTTSTYIRIILRAVKGCASVKQSCVHANYDRRQNLP